MTLPYDIARCDGRITYRELGNRIAMLATGNAGNSEWHSDCLLCRRREPGHPDQQLSMPVPAFVAGKCPERI